MHCTKCGAALKENAKFCTKCGQKVTVEAPQAEAPAPEPAKAEEAEARPSDINNVNGRICWNIQPGQIARVIDEAELNSYANVKGIIIQEGTRAYIRSNGSTIATISGGSYELTQTQTNVAEDIKEGISGAWGYIVNLFRKDKEAKSPDTKKAQQELILKNARSKASFSIVILLEKAFPLLVGRKRAALDDYKDILPMRISTKYLDVELILNAYFKISDNEKFILHYLSDCKSLNTTMVLHEISGAVRRAVQDSLHDQDLQSAQVSKELYASVKESINAAAAEAFFGVSLVRIVEISIDNKDLERFRALSAEMYLSEKELDYLKRTNDFKNRLADTVNEQKLHEARTELDLNRALDAINNDNLLREDELERFRHVLQNERLVHDAKSDAERDAALNELYKSELLRKEDVDVLKMQLETNEESRSHALQMMRMRDSIEFERLRLEGETEKAISIAKADLAKQGLYDEYADGRFYKELEKRKAAAELDLDLERRKREMDREDDDAQFQQFMAMRNAEEQSKLNELKHKEDMERLKWESAANLSEDKVWALSGNDNAQYKYNAEHEREKRELLEAQRREEQDRLERMMMQMLAANGNIQAQRDAERERQLQEKEERIQRQENRMDTAYDRALDYTTKNNVQQPRPQAVQPSAPAFCPECGAAVKPGQKSCDDCGSEI